MDFYDWEIGSEFGLYKYQNDINNEIHYIGKSDVKIKQRVDDHSKDPRFEDYLSDQIYVMPLANKAETGGLEKLLIDKYKPILNIEDKYDSILSINIIEPEWYLYSDYLRYLRTIAILDTDIFTLDGSHNTDYIIGNIIIFQEILYSIFTELDFGIGYDTNKNLIAICNTKDGLINISLIKKMLTNEAIFIGNINLSIVYNGILITGFKNINKGRLLSAIRKYNKMLNELSNETVLL